MRYENPHAREVEALLRKNAAQLPLESVLDLACGTGLITSVLKDLGFDAIGLDQFLGSDYTARTGRPCYQMSFKEVAYGGLPNHKFSCIICSFALHLCPKSMMPDLLWRLSERSNTLVVISPTKFPLIGKPEVENFYSTSANKRIHFRTYNLPILHD